MPSRRSPRREDQPTEGLAAGGSAARSEAAFAVECKSFGTSGPTLGRLRSRSVCRCHCSTSSPSMRSGRRAGPPLRLAAHRPADVEARRPIRPWRPECWPASECSPWSATMGLTVPFRRWSRSRMVPHPNDLSRSPQRLELLVEVEDKSRGRRTSGVPRGHRVQTSDEVWGAGDIEGEVLVVGVGGHRVVSRVLVPGMQPSQL